MKNNTAVYTVLSNTIPYHTVIKSEISLILPKRETPHVCYICRLTSPNWKDNNF